MSAEVSSPASGDSEAANYLQTITKWVQSNFMTIFLIIYVIAKVYIGRRPIPEVGGSLVRGIKDGFHWDQVFAEAKAGKSIALNTYFLNKYILRILFF